MKNLKSFYLPEIILFILTWFYGFIVYTLFTNIFSILEYFSLLFNFEKNYWLFYNENLIFYLLLFIYLLLLGSYGLIIIFFNKNFSIKNDFFVIWWNFQELFVKVTILFISFIIFSFPILINYIELWNWIKIIKENISNTKYKQWQICFYKKESSKEKKLLFCWAKNQKIYPKLNFKEEILKRL